MNRWLLKTEPGEYSFQDLIAEGVTAWDGVKAPAALKNMRSVKKGDPVFIYHTGKEKAVVGTARAVSEAYPDPAQDDSRLLAIDIEAEKAFPKPVTLAKIKESNLFPEWELVRMPRLSVVPVTEKQWDLVNRWGL